MAKVWCLFWVLVALVAPASAQDRDWVPVKKFLEMTYLDKYYDTPQAERNKIRAYPFIAPVNKAIKVTDIVFTVVHTGGKNVVPVRANGTFDLQLTPKIIQENPMIQTNVAKGEKVGMGQNIYAVLPDTTKLPYAELIGGVNQAKAIVKRAAGMLSVFAPKLNGVIIRFAKPAQQTVQIATSAGVKTLTADAKGEVKLKLDEQLLAENPQVSLSEAALEVEIDQL